MFANKPGVTVGISFFNAESTLHYAIESVLRQDLSDFELILVNDGSTDGSVNLAERYLSDTRITLVSDGTRKGLAPRLNEIAVRAGSDIIARMDADDIMLPGRLSRQLSVLTSRPDVDVVGTGAYFLGAHGQVVGKRTTPVVRLCRKFSYLQLFHPTVMGRKQWFLLNPYSDHFLRCEDTELWIRSGGGGNLIAIEEPLLFYNRYGTFDVDKILASLEQFERIVSLHRHKTCTACRTRHIFFSKLKRLAYWTGSMVGLTPTVFDFKIQRLDQAERERVEGVVAEIRSAAERRRIDVLINSPATSPCGLG